MASLDPFEICNNTKTLLYCLPCLFAKIYSLNDIKEVSVKVINMYKS